MYKCLSKGIVRIGDAEAYRGASTIHGLLESVQFLRLLVQYTDKEVHTLTSSSCLRIVGGRLLGLLDVEDGM